MIYIVDKIKDIILILIGTSCKYRLSSNYLLLKAFQPSLINEITSMLHIVQSST